MDRTGTRRRARDQISKSAQQAVTTLISTQTTFKELTSNFSRQMAADVLLSIFNPLVGESAALQSNI